MDYASDKINQRNFPGYIMKLIEANSVYSHMDKANQEIGLKMLVSLCKRYEMLLGNRYTLQTCVWYNLGGIENFFDEMCADLKASFDTETVSTSETESGLANNSTTVIDYLGNNQECMQANPVIANYVVNTSEDFEVTEDTEHDTEHDIVPENTENVHINEDTENDTETGDTEHRNVTDDSTSGNENEGTVNANVTEDPENGNVIEYTENCNVNEVSENGNINEDTENGDDTVEEEGEVRQEHCCNVFIDNQNCVHLISGYNDDIDSQNCVHLIQGPDGKVRREHCCNDDTDPQKCGHLIQGSNEHNSDDQYNESINAILEREGSDNNEVQVLVYNDNESTSFHGANQLCKESDEYDDCVKINDSRKTAPCVYQPREVRTYVEEINSEDEPTQDTGRIKKTVLENYTKLDKSGRQIKSNNDCTEEVCLVNRTRKQKHPTRKVSPLKINLKKKLGYHRGCESQVISGVIDYSGVFKKQAEVQNSCYDTTIRSAILNTDKSHSRDTSDTAEQHNDIINNDNVNNSDTIQLTQVKCVNGRDEKLKRLKLSKSAKKARLLQALDINPRQISTGVRKSSRQHLRRLNSLKTPSFNQDHSDEKHLNKKAANKVILEYCEVTNTDRLIEGSIKIYNSCGKKNNGKVKPDIYGSSVKEQLDQKIVKTLKRLERHKRQNNLRCYICGEEFSRKRFLYRHYRTHSEGRFACLKCGAFNEHAGELQEHMEHHTRPTSDSCKASLEGMQQYEAHVEGHRTDLESHVEGHRTSLEAQVEGHRAIPRGSFHLSLATDGHHVESGEDLQGTNLYSSLEKFTCQICSGQFKTMSLLSRHLRHHTGEVHFVCSVCKVFFGTAKALGRHKRTNGHRVKAGERQVERKYLCQDCGKSFFKKHGLHRHMRVHLGEKQQECQYCDFRCQEANNLKRHMSLHFESERNFVCEICGAAFHAKKTLEVHHTYKHSSERQFKCSQCFISFKDKSALKRHEKVHTLDKEHKCVCGTAFRRVCNLRRHIRLVHGGDENYVSLPPVKHVTTLDFQKKVPVSKTDLANQFKDNYEGESLYEDVHETSVEMSHFSTVNDNSYAESDKVYRVSLLKTGVTESSSDTVVAGDVNIVDDRTATASDYSQQDRTTSDETLHKPDEPQDSDRSHQMVPHISNSLETKNANHHFPDREMMVGSFCFPHLAMASNNINEQQTSVLPHIHMLQNSQMKDSLPMTLPMPTQPKFTLTFGNHWQKLFQNEIDCGYRDHEHSFRFPGAHFDNSVLVSQRLANQDPRNALHVNQDPRNALHEDINMRIQQEELNQKLISESQSVEQNLLTEKLVSDANYTNSYHATSAYNQHTDSSYEPVASEKAGMSELSEESEYFQSRREMAAESLAQMAALAMDGNY